MHRFRGARCAAREGSGDGLCRLRLHRRQPAYRQPDVDHAAALVPEDRQQADRIDGRRHDEDRRPLREGRIPPAFVRRADRPQHGRDPPGLRQIPAIRQPRGRRGHGQQRRLARWIALHPVPARCRPAFLGQPHADARQRPAAARTRPAAQLSRIQLPDPAGLRFPRAEPAPGVRVADGRLRPVGQHRERRRIGAAQRRADIVRTDDAARDDSVGREDGQNRAGRRLAQCRAAVGLRVLAVLAQHRGRRCRPLYAPLYRIAARRNRKA